MVRLVKFSGLEALLRAFDIENNPALLNEVQKLLGVVPSGISQKFVKWPHEIQVDKFISLLDILVTKFYSGLPHNKGLEELGRTVITGYQQTILGRVQFAATKLRPPTSTAKRVLLPINMGANFGKRSYEQLAKNKFLYKFEDDPMPADYVAGVLAEGFKATGAKNIRVSYQRIGPENTHYTLEWDD